MQTVIFTDRGSFRIPRFNRRHLRACIFNSQGCRRFLVCFFPQLREERAGVRKDDDLRRPADKILDRLGGRKSPAIIQAGGRVVQHNYRVGERGRIFMKRGEEERERERVPVARTKASAEGRSRGSSDFRRGDPDLCLVDYQLIARTGDAASVRGLQRFNAKVRIELDKKIVDRRLVGYEYFFTVVIEGGLRRLFFLFRLRLRKLRCEVVLTFLRDVPSVTPLYGFQLRDCRGQLALSRRQSPFFARVAKCSAL